MAYSELRTLINVAKTHNGVPQFWRATFCAAYARHMLLHFLLFFFSANCLLINEYCFLPILLWSCILCKFSCFSFTTSPSLRFLKINMHNVINSRHTCMYCCCYCMCVFISYFCVVRYVRIARLRVYVFGIFVATMHITIIFATCHNHFCMRTIRLGPKQSQPQSPYHPHRCRQSHRRRRHVCATHCAAFRAATPFSSALRTAEILCGTFKKSIITEANARRNEWTMKICPTTFALKE